MGARPRPITHQGIHYASVGWALGDVLRLHPLANDQQIAEEAWSWGIQLSGETVRRHSNAMGIAPARVRRRLRLDR